MSGSPDISASSVSTAGYEDGLGRRSVRFNREVGGMLECLHLRPQFAVFEAALRARAEALGRLEDERFAVVRDFEKDATGLRVISDLVAGQRLIDVLESRSDEAAVSGIDAAFGFLLQAMPALAQLHAHSITHGAVAPGRIIITPNSQVVLLDNIYGAALDRLTPTRQTLWTSFGVMLAPVSGVVSLDRHVDVSQVTLCALLLALGRPLDQNASVASLAPLVREIAELAEIRAGASFAEGVGRFFIDALPAVGKRRTLEADEAAVVIRRLLTHISEDESLNALAELVSYRPVPVRPRAASPIEIERPRTAIPSQVVAPPAPIDTPPPVAPVPFAEPPPPPVLVPPPSVAVQAPPVPVQPTFVAVQPPRVPVGPPLLSGPVIPPVHIVQQAPISDLKIRQDGPAGYTPIRIKESERAPEAEPTARALAFLDRAAEQGGGFPWKIAAAAVLVLLVGAAAGRDYLLGGTDAAPAEKVATPAPAPVVASTTTGGLVIDSQPSGAKVTLDGKDVGTTPLTLEAIKPGRHQVTVTSGSALVQRSIRIEAGKQSTINVPVFSGWVAIFAPIRLEVSAGRRSLGSTEDRRILLPPGKHVLTLSSAEFGYTRTETVEISPGEERVLNLQPTGSVNLNASPWAEVWIDGKRAGETPLANLAVPLGTREFVFKHPQYGERKLTAVVTTTTSALSVDFGRPPSKP